MEQAPDLTREAVQEGNKVVVAEGLQKAPSRSQEDLDEFLHLALSHGHTEVAGTWSIAASIPNAR